MVMKKATTIRRPMQDEGLCTMFVEDPSTNRADTIIPAMYVNLVCVIREPRYWRVDRGLERSPS
jgi:hypothetical protein